MGSSQGTENENKKEKGRDRYHHGDLRAGLVEAIRQLVERHGPDRFSISDACKIAGVSTAAPYRHFADREEMLLEVVLAGMARFHTAMADAARQHPSGTLEVIAALGRAYLDFATSEPGVFRLMFGLSQRAGAKGTAETRERGMAIYGVLLAEIAAYLGRDAVDAEVERRAFPLWTSVHGFAFLLIDDKTEHLGLEVRRDEVIADISARLLQD